MTTTLDAVLTAIDGALADDAFPDAMRWSPTPDTVEDAGDPYGIEDDDDIDRPPRVHPGLSIYCAALRHTDCRPGCRLCTCHDQPIPETPGA